MFGFLKKRRELQAARTKIGIDLHRQIRDALNADDEGTSERLNSSFIVGYIYAFVRCGLMSLGINAESGVNAHVRYICDGVIPGRLYKIYSGQAAALELARQMKEQDKEILNTGLAPADVSKAFELGIRAGTYDAPLVSIRSMPPDNLRRYLLNEALRLQ